MSKAYDSVNLDLLKLALERIQIPSQLYYIITNLLTNRTNRVITNLGLTEPYNIDNIANLFVSYMFGFKSIS